MFALCFNVPWCDLPTLLSDLAHSNLQEVVLFNKLHGLQFVEMLAYAWKTQIKLAEFPLGCYCNRLKQENASLMLNKRSKKREK